MALQDGVANLVSSLVGGNAIQARAKTAEEARMLAVQEQRAQVDKRISDAIMAAGGVTDANAIRAEYPGAAGGIIIGNHGPSLKSYAEAQGIGTQNDSRAAAAKLAAEISDPTDRYNAYIGVAGDKMLGTGNVQVQDQADAAIEAAIAKAYASQQSGGASAANADLARAKIPFVGESARLAAELSGAKLKNEELKYETGVTKRDMGAAKVGAAKNAAVQKADLVMGKVDEALGMTSGWTTGMLSDQLASIGGTDARNLSATLDTIKANLGFDALQQMRDASPTGGALGQVAVKELDMLQSTIASLDQGQDAATLKQSLEQVRQHYQAWRDAVSQAGGEAAPAGDSAAEQIIGGKRYTQVNGQWYEQ